MSGEPFLGAARVRASRRAGTYRSLAIEAPEIAARAAPGQFVSLEVCPGSPHLLRRPFSIAGAAAGEVEILFDVVGPGTEWLARRSAGDEVGVLGPLGRPFGNGARNALLVGGGFGVAPLLFLAERMRTEGARAHMILGAARADRVLGADRARRVAEKVWITTEDGSGGRRGLVTDVLGEAVAATRPDAVRACGPMGMLEAVAAACARLEVPCEVAVEEFMACGIGVCWTCVLPVKENGSVSMRRSCADGPVFDGARVAWG